jgi:HK97 family phage major capsid protein
MSTEREDLQNAIKSMEATFGNARAETEEKFKLIDANSAEAKQLIANASADMQKKYDEMEAKQKALSAAMNRKTFENSSDEKKAIKSREDAKIREWMKSNAQGGNATTWLNDCVGKYILQQTKDLSVDNDPAGGFTVRSQTEQMIDATVTEYSAFAQFARNVNLTNSDHMERIINKKGGVGATRGGSERTAPEDTGQPSLAQNKIFANFMDADVNVTQQLLDDSGMDIGGLLNAEAAEDFAVRMDEESFIGGAAGRPFANLEMRGILTYAAGTGYGQIEQVNSGVSAGFDTDTLLKLVGSQKEAYSNGSRFFAKRETIFTDLFSLKDEEGRHFLINDFSMGVSFKLLGFPIHAAPSMPVAADGSLSLAFGNFGRAYTIVTRSGIQIMRDPYTEYPSIKFRYRKRIGGDVEVFEAIKLYKLSV